MVSINVIGRLGSKPDIKTTEKGSEYVTFDFAVDDYNRGEKETVWFKVADFTPNAKRRAEHLNKGSLVHIQGTEKVRIYEDKTHKPRIARDIQVTFMDFISTGTKQEQQENVNCGTLTNTQQQQTQPQQPVNVQQPVQQQYVAPQSTGAPIPPQSQTFAQNPQQPMQQSAQQQAYANAGGYPTTSDIEDDLPF